MAKAEDLVGADKETNRDIALEVLQGVTGPKRDIVLVNAAVALVAAGRRASSDRARSLLRSRSIKGMH